MQKLRGQRLQGSVLVMEEAPACWPKTHGFPIRVHYRQRKQTALTQWIWPNGVSCYTPGR